MDTKPDTVEFSFGWLALKLLGQNLYSNAWSAISELVANGLDAQANNVYVYIDICNKENSLIEVFDDGSGMNKDDLSNYAMVGRNRREFDIEKNKLDSYKIMGRKGIGKLAALYLSEDYYIVTKTKDSVESMWHMKYDETRPSDEKPFLETVENVKIICEKEWNQIKTGTMIQMNNVNLMGLGEAAFESLRHKLSNYFSLNSLGERNIFLFVKTTDKDTTIFEAISKKIAFKNMTYIDYNLDESNPVSKLMDDLNGKGVLCPYTKISWKDKQYTHELETTKFESINLLNSNKKGDVTYKGIYQYNGENYEYELKGWIGIHSTIETDRAWENDANFNKNKFYNPIQLRLYVRNKLAVENYLNILNMTQTFVNYIEGEVSFDLLDHTDLPDIATTNRQGLNESDARVELLTSILKKIVGDLIRKKNDLSAKIADDQKGYLDSKADTAKKIFKSDVNREMNRIKGVDNNLMGDVTANIINKIKGDVVPKDNYVVFISYSHFDSCISDFFYEYLKHIGVLDRELFYTDHKDYDDLRPLAKQIRDNITDDNTLLFFITSSDYKRSEYCLFEGGAGWATRSVGEYIILSLRYEDIPGYLSNGKAEYTLLIDNCLSLDRKRYACIVSILNSIIDHINSGRQIRMESDIKRINAPDIPSDIDISETGTKLENFMDPTIQKYWTYYVVNGEEKYLDCRKKRNESYQKVKDDIDAESNKK